MNCSLKMRSASGLGDKTTSCFFSKANIREPHITWLWAHPACPVLLARESVSASMVGACSFKAEPELLYLFFMDEVEKVDDVDGRSSEA